MSAGAVVGVAVEEAAGVVEPVPQAVFKSASPCRPRLSRRITTRKPLPKFYLSRPNFFQVPGPQLPLPLEAPRV